MFNKTNKQPAQPAAAPKPAPVAPVDTPNVNFNKKPTSTPMGGAKPFSSVGSGLMVDGNITGSGDLHLDGTVKGDVKVSHLTVGESGNIEGKVEAETIEVRGRIVGSIQGRQIKLQATAYVEGDITHETLAIDVGAYFQGRCLQRRPAESQSVSSPAAQVGNDYGVSPVAAPSTTSTPTPASGSGMSNYDMSALSDLN
ncbi:MAG TPA: polymer-forming cytoskeletal protein [Asticcacaulis sp.]|nr:polymer-forming cytoskeletal protein [Asticcacaulis sp.]